MMIEFGLTTLVVFLASFIGTLAGFGTSTVMFPVLLFYMSHQEALVFTSIIHLCTDISKMIFFKKGFNIHIILFFGIPAIIASMIGAFFVFDISLILFKHILALFLLSYAALIFLKPTFSIKPSNSLLIGGGMLTGFSAGFFGMRGVIRSLMLSMYNLPKTVYLATVGIIAFLVDISRISMYIYKGFNIPVHYALIIFFYVPLSFVASYSARLLVHTISEILFRKIIVFFLAVMGALLLFNIV